MVFVFNYSQNYTDQLTILWRIKSRNYIISYAGNRLTQPQPRRKTNIYFDHWDWEMESSDFPLLYIGQLSCWPHSGQHYNQYDICTTSSHLSKYEYQDETQSRANNQHSFLSLIFPNKNLINILKIIKERKREMNYYFLYIFVGKMCFLFPTIEKERCREFWVEGLDYYCESI